MQPNVTNKHGAAWFTENAAAAAAAVSICATFTSNRHVCHSLTPASLPSLLVCADLQTDGLLSKGRKAGGSA